MRQQKKRMAKVRDEEFFPNPLEFGRGLLIAFPVCAVFWIGLVYTIKALF